MANYSDKNKKLIKEVLTQALENSKDFNENWLFLCNQIRYVVKESYDEDPKIFKLVLGYFRRQKPTKTGKYKDFYNHPGFEGRRSVEGSWWYTTESGKEQRLLFLKTIIDNL